MEWFLVEIGCFVCEYACEPDAGIWEVRSEPYAYTHSRALAWVALDRLCALERDGLLRKRLPNDFARVRDAIRADIETHGWNELFGSYTGCFDGEELDVVLLFLL